MNSPDAPAVPSGGSLQRRILMVDDDAGSLAAFAMLLRLEGATVETSTSAAEALQMLEGGDYDVVLSDIGMPGMSGLQFMRRARELPTAKPFHSLAISGYGRELDVQSALEAGFDGHLSKPISLQRLKEALERL